MRDLGVFEKFQKGLIDERGERGEGGGARGCRTLLLAAAASSQEEDAERVPLSLSLALSSAANEATSICRRKPPQLSPAARLFLLRPCPRHPQASRHKVKPPGQDRLLELAFFFGTVPTFPALQLSLQPRKRPAERGNKAGMKKIQARESPQAEHQHGSSPAVVLTETLDDFCRISSS